MLFRQLLRGLTSRTYGGDDAYLLTWWLRWTPYAIAHGHLPLRTGWLGYPHGVNAMWNTSLLLLGIIGWPVTAVAGPLATYNSLLILAPPLSALACYLLARRLFRAEVPAFVAGLLYGFGPFCVGQSAGHLQMTWALFPPLLAGLSIELLFMQRRRPAGLGIVLGIAVGAQLLIGEELLASSALVLTLSTVVLVLVYRDRVRPRLRYAAQTLAWSAATAFAIDALPLYEQFFGPQRVSGQVQAQAPGADLASYVLPTTSQALHIPALADLVNTVNGTNLTEQTAYLGAPLILILVLAVATTRRTAVRLLAVPLAISWALSLGRHLVVVGHRTGVPLPGALVGHVPVLQSMLPVRFTLYTDLFAALLLAGWLSQPCATRSAGLARGGLVTLAALSLLPSALPAFAVTVPGYFTSTADRAALPNDAAVFVAPYPGPGAAGPMLWQAESGLRFRMVGGYFVGPDANGHPVFGAPPGATAQVVSAIQKGSAAPSANSPSAGAVARELTSERIDAVLVGPMPHADAVVAFFHQALARPARSIDGVWLIRLTGPDAKSERAPATLSRGVR